MVRRGSEAGIGYGRAFLLVFGFLIASVLIFLFGIWVGRDLTERRLIDEEPVVRATIPAQPSPAADGVGREFYDKLKEKAYEALQTPEQPAKATPTMPPPTRTLPQPTATRVSPTVKPTARPTKPPVARSTPTAGAPEAGAEGEWSVQVSATMDSREALALTLRLRGLGFQAYTVQAPLRGQTWYRVRVGRFRTREEAREVEAKLRQTGEFQGAYVTSQ